MTTTVGAEGTVVFAPCVRGRVTGRASRIEGLIVHGDPVGVEVRIRLRPATDLDIRDKLIGTDDDRDGVA